VQSAHLFLADQRLPDTTQAEKRHVARPAHQQVIGDQRQGGQLADSIGEVGGCGVDAGHVKTSMLIQMAYKAFGLGKYATDHRVASNRPAGNGAPDLRPTRQS